MLPTPALMAFPRLETDLSSANETLLENTHRGSGNGARFLSHQIKQRPSCLLLHLCDDKLEPEVSELLRLDEFLLVLDRSSGDQLVWRPRDQPT